MENYIVFDEKVSTYTFYSDIIKKFYYIYTNCGPNVPPVLDFRNTNYISSTATPVLLSFGDYLRRLYGTKIKILFITGSKLHTFFVDSKFYEISRELGLFDWEQDLYIGYVCGGLRNLHKITYTKLRYDDAETITDDLLKRNYIFDSLKEKSRVIYDRILRETDRLPDGVIDATIDSISEIETNAIMYSQSYSFTFVSSDLFGTTIGIADAGIGFEKSFSEAKRELEMSQKYASYGNRFRNYLIIMSVLNYSYAKHFKDRRSDLWSLRTNVVNNFGIFKISYENTQVIFSHKRCSKCKKLLDSDSISCCVECLYENYCEGTYSPIKIYDIGMQGVRVEITINKEG